jgi:hypothetical protein
MTKLLYPPERSLHRPSHEFDPVVEGARYQLTRELSLAIWKRVCADATDSLGRRDQDQAQRRFHELTARLAARGGRLRPDVGRLTRVGTELDGVSVMTSVEEKLAVRAPGRETLVATEARRWAERGQATAVDAAATMSREAREPPESRSWLEQGAPGRLPAATLDRMERAFGQRFDDVELHVDSADVPAGQQAFTQGGHIYLERGAVELETEHGQHVVAHELAHVVQQSRATSHGPVAPRADLEADAHQAALSALSNRAVVVRYSAPATAMLGFSSGQADGEPRAMIGPEIRAGGGTTAELRAELKRLVDEQSRYHHSAIEPEREAVYNKYTTSISRLRVLLAEREDSTLPDSTVGLTFDGKALTMAGSSAGAWPAVSGRPDAAGKFDYSAARQHQQDIGPIPEGQYWIDPKQMIDLQSRWFYTLRYKEPWGTHRITIHPFDSTQTFGRGGFFIHGGGTAGSAGCIDLTQQVADFAHRLAATPPGTKVKITVSYGGSGLPATAAVPTNPAAIDTTGITITYGANADKSAVAASCEIVIKELVAQAGDTSCTITSTVRTPEDQARAMYTNLENLGVESQKALYGNAGDKVIDVYVASSAASKTADQIKADMVAKINELGPSNVSKHCGDSSTLCVVDIDPGSITHKAKFIEEVDKDSRVSKFLQPPADPAYHLEIPV